MPDYEVTAELLERAVRKDSRHCLVAEAIKAAQPELRNVSVDLATIRYTDPKRGKRLVFLTPLRAQAAIISFDAGVPAERWEPFTFHLPRKAVQEHEAKQTTSRKDRARRVVKVNGARGVPQVKGGEPLPHTIGASGNGVRVGRRREYGLRALVR